MSDLHDLIHTNATRAYMTGQTRGRIEERERIIKLLEDECEGDWPKFIEMSLDSLKALIKGEQK